MDREAIARSQRRRQVEEALDEERGREAALTERLEDVVAEVGGPGIDEGAFALMEQDDVAIVRELFRVPSPFDEDDPDELEAFLGADEDGGRAGPVLEEEVARLQEEIADSQRRQRAYRRYVDAVDAARAGPGDSG